mmetsp:Transcript_16067/g.46888  ORF Transcript_16067/g.46888 Transcript_16067/m.46888 type:complete len:270 (+) Transcript_16067:233-1042(+)
MASRSCSPWTAGATPVAWLCRPTRPGTAARSSPPLPLATRPTRAALDSLPGGRPSARLSGGDTTSRATPSAACPSPSLPAVSVPGPTPPPLAVRRTAPSLPSSMTRPTSSCCGVTQRWWDCRPDPTKSGRGVTTTESPPQTSTAQAAPPWQEYATPRRCTRPAPWASPRPQASRNPPSCACPWRTGALRARPSPRWRVRCWRAWTPAAAPSAGPCASCPALQASRRAGSSSAGTACGRAASLAPRARPVRGPTRPVPPTRSCRASASRA